MTTARLLCVIGVLCVGSATRAQEPAAPQAVSPQQLQDAIDKLGNLDYAVRTNASRTVRRTPGSQAVPALLQAVAGHSDGYVRYRALVLLTGFNDSRTLAAMREVLTSPNDRLRAVAYSYFEHNPDVAMAPTLLNALEKEIAEFVRPALIRALAALGADPRVRPILVRESGRGEDFFRSAVIEALGDYKADYAIDSLIGIANLDGPLVDDAALALGKIGDRRALDTLAHLQQKGPRTAQPFVATAACLLGSDCPTHEEYLVQTLKYPEAARGQPELLRGAAAGLGALAISGRTSALGALIDVGISSRDPARAPIALAVATAALRNTRLMLAVLEPYPRRADAIALLADGFDMLEEDFEKERFFMYVRRTYWGAVDASATGPLMQTLIGKLDF